MSKNYCAVTFIRKVLSRKNISPGPQAKCLIKHINMKFGQILAEVNVSIFLACNSRSIH